QIAPLIQRTLFDFSVIALVELGLLLVGTLLFGRFYCSTLCPLGVLQEVEKYFLDEIGISPKTSKHSWGIKYIIAALSFGAVVGIGAVILKYVEPYTIFSGMLTNGVGFITACVIFALVFFKNRFFCVNICPVGTFLGLISKFSVNKIYIDKETCVGCNSCERMCPTGSISDKEINNETCVRCLKCFDVCNKNAIKYGKQAEVKFNPKRREMIWGVAALALFAGAYAAGVRFSKDLSKKIRRVILPAGSTDAKTMENKCLNCNLCVESCPHNILQPASEEFPAVHINYARGKRHCKFDCKKCSEVCPSGAIKKLTIEEKQHTKIAMATILPHCNGCRHCINSCPVNAISIDNHVAKIDSKCIGCGKCVLSCRKGAIRIVAIPEQTKI
ncbi:4Fe-4S binding protein, partial [bacterium]|nr:4Fe-4S binding protein [bacterium]